VFAFEQLNVEELMLQVNPDNEPALQFFDKNGLRFLDIEVLNSDATGVNASSCTMGLYRQHWQKEILAAATDAREQINSYPSENRALF